MAGFSFSTNPSSSPCSSSSSPSPFTSSSLFGALPASSAPFGGFGAPSSASAFGFGAAAPATLSPFGGSNLFRSSSSAGISTSTTSNLFANSAPAFGTGGLFGASSISATSSPAFGTGGLFGVSSASNTSVAAPATTTSSAPVFGASSIFGAEEALFSNVHKVELVQARPAPKEVSSPQSGIICVQGYKVKNVYAPILEAILNKHGDIASTCVFTDAAMRTSLLEAVCDIVRRIEMNDVTNIMSSIKEIESQLHVAEVAKINVSWLQAHLEAIHKSYEAEKKATMLMELQTNTILVERAARSDLKERHAKLVAAQNEFAEAERCVEVLKLVEKKLNNDVLELKAEKELLARKPVI